MPACECEEQRGKSEERREEHHESRQPIRNKDDAQGSGPCAKRVDVRDPRTGLPHQGSGCHQQQEHRHHADGGLHRVARLVDDQEQRAGEQRHDDRKHDQVLEELAHGSGSRPSTWSVPVRPLAASSTTNSNAVVANAITMAVRTSACGRGSANRAGSGACVVETNGAAPARTQPIMKMNRLTAYDSSDNPTITWKVRARRISQTPEPVSTAMPRATMISIRPFPTCGAPASTGAR